jgi:hypothetical protein
VEDAINVLVTEMGEGGKESSLFTGYEHGGTGWDGEVTSHSCSMQECSQKGKYRAELDS